MLYCKMRHIEHQNDLCTKNANNRFLSKIREYWIDVRLRIVKLESGGQQLPVTKKNLSRNIFNLSKSSFLLKVLKTCFYPNHKMLNSYTFASSRIKSKSLDSTIDKRKHLCIPYTARKNDIFIKKSQKYSFLT